MPRPPKPSPPLPKRQAAELARVAECTEPTPIGTLEGWPLNLHGLVRQVGGQYPQYVITARGRAWLAADAAYRASAPRRRRVSGTTPPPVDTTR